MGSCTRVESDLQVYKVILQFCMFIAILLLLKCGALHIILSNMGCGFMHFVTCSFSCTLFYGTDNAPPPKKNNKKKHEYITVCFHIIIAHVTYAM